MTPGKRLAIVLRWLAQGISYFELTALYVVSVSTIVAVVHDLVDDLRQVLVPDAICFTTGQEQDQIIVMFEDLCGVPACAGALDGEFMGIKSLQNMKTLTIATKYASTLLC